MRKITNKAVSAILVLALCVGALCGALIPAYAAATGNTYSVVGESVAAGTKVTTATVTLSSTTGLTSGTFDLMFGSDVIDDVNFDANGNYVTPTNETLEEFYGYQSNIFQMIMENQIQLKALLLTPTYL